MQPLSGNQRPELLTSLMNMSLVLHLPRKMHLCRSSSNDPCLPSFLEMLQNLHIFLTFDKVQNPLCLPHKTPLQRPKVARACGALYILTSIFFNISSSQSAPTLRSFDHFSFKMCFAPQRRALFRHLNFVKVLRS